MNVCNNQIAEKCNAWINKEKTFYHNSIRKVRKYGNLAGLLHIYRLGSDYTQCKDVFRGVTDYEEFVKCYHNRIHSTLGVRTLLAWSWKSNEDIKLFCTSWLIHGDLYKSIIYQIMKYFSNPLYMNMEQDLNDFKNRLIYESVYLGIKSTEYWMKYDMDMRNTKRWIILSEDFKNILSSYIKKAEPISIEENIDIDSNYKNLEEKKYITLTKITNNVNHTAKKTTSSNTMDKTLEDVLKCKNKERVIEYIVKEYQYAEKNKCKRLACIRLALEEIYWIDTDICHKTFHAAFQAAFQSVSNPNDMIISRENYNSEYNNIKKGNDNSNAGEYIKSVVEKLKKIGAEQE